jgi:hypothetical protein
LHIETKEKKMEIISKKKNCLGTMSFTMKLGKMKKAEEFCTYPIQRGDKGEKVCFQSEHRWAELDIKTGEFVVSARRAQYANSMWLLECKLKKTVETDKATEEQLSEILNAIRGTVSEKCGSNGIMYCDNSNAKIV